PMYLTKQGEVLEAEGTCTVVERIVLLFEERRRGMSSRDTIRTIREIDAILENMLDNVETLERISKASNADTVRLAIGSHVDHVRFSVSRIQQNSDDLRRTFQTFDRPDSDEIDSCEE